MKRTKVSTVTARHPPLFDGGPVIVYWAQGGYVLCMDERDGVADRDRVQKMTWREAGDRVLALSQMNFNSSEFPGWAHERRMHQRFISEMEHVIREAKQQSDAALVRVHSKPKVSGVLVPQFTFE